MLNHPMTLLKNCQNDCLTYCCCCCFSKNEVEIENEVSEDRKQTSMIPASNIEDGEVDNERT